MPRPHYCIAAVALFCRRAGDDVRVLARRAGADCRQSRFRWAGVWRVEYLRARRIDFARCRAHAIRCWAESVAIDGENSALRGAIIADGHICTPPSCFNIRLGAPGRILFYFRRHARMRARRVLDFRRT